MKPAAFRNIDSELYLLPPATFSSKEDDRSLAMLLSKEERGCPRIFSRAPMWADRLFDSGLPSHPHESHVQIVRAIVT